MHNTGLGIKQFPNSRYSLSLPYINVAIELKTVQSIKRFSNAISLANIRMSSQYAHPHDV